MIVADQFPQKKLVAAVIPALFIFLWSTGFISAKYGLPYTTPFTFLLVRMLLTLVVLGGIIFLTGAKWPQDWTSVFHLSVSGLLIHTLYLGGVFASIKAGLLAGICSVIVGLQPIVTTIFSLIFLGTLFTRLQLWGLLSGFMGITLVIFGNKIGQVNNLDTGITTTALTFALLALLGISGGTLYQKKYCGSAPLLTGAFIQYTITGISMGIIAYIFEPMEIEFTKEFILALSWLVLGLSIAAILLLLFMIREGEAAKVASLFYLTPPLTALESFFLFNEQLSVPTLLGMGFAAFGVFMVIYTPRKKRVLHN
jgi:drug/metabolite transporter (DMT)-like permease